ncbi:MAG TPA: GNAT family N-acetyltransferase [Kofleriaceae bacterium]|nr:GNAT family N-acetyltransferase [Kofleriaceae bacterium]
MTDPDLHHYRREAILRDGESIVVRAIEPSDKPQLVELFRRLSPRSVHQRFMAAKRGLSAPELAYMTEVDFAHHVALVAVRQQHGRDDMVGVGRYILTDASGREPAEVAFAVVDQEQGRGIGTALLEHLARIGQDLGVTRFSAEVLAENSQMLRVFADSGFELKQALDDDVYHVVFPVDETDRFAGASLERERQAAGHSVRVFFAPSSVAVVGASRTVGTIGRALLDNLVACGFTGRIHPVHPIATEIAGIPCVSRVSEIEGGVDLAVIAVPAAAVPAVLEDCARAGVRGAVVISSGFAEATPEGRAAEHRLREIARGAGMRMVGPNCMGVLTTDPAVRLNATFSPVFPPAGNVSMLTQSGALGLAMLDYAEKLRIGIADFVSVGNKADVSGNDLLSYWQDDPRTKVVVLYLESLGNPRKFARLAPAVARVKPIVAVKSGRSAAGTRAASSHSAALASLDVGVDALFAQAGVIRTSTLEEMFDVVALLSSQPVPKGPRIGVVTNAGGPGILLADACEAQGLSLPPMSEETLDRLRAILPAQAGLSNPIDMIASASAATYEQVIGLVGADDAVDAVVSIYVPPLVTRPEEIAAAIARAAGALPAHKPIATVYMSSRGIPAELSRGPRGAIPSYSFPENAAIALAAAVRYGRWRARPVSPRATLDPDQEQAVRLIVDRLRRDMPGGGWIASTDLFALLAAVGVAMAPFRSTGIDLDEVLVAGEEIGYPVALKAVAPGLLHKSDAGGVALSLESPAALRRAAEEMARRLRAAGFAPGGYLVQKQIARGVEALVGVTTDPSLGPLLVAGFGGVEVELFRDVAFRLTPISRLDAREMLDELKGRALLDGYRGSPPADRDALIETILRIGALVEAMPELAELDLNPVVVHQPGQGAIAVDGRLRLAPAPSG